MKKIIITSKEVKKIIKNRIDKENLNLKEISTLTDIKIQTVRNYLSTNGRMSSKFIKSILKNVNFNEKEKEKIKFYLESLQKKMIKEIDEQISLKFLMELLEENKKIKEELKIKNIMFSNHSKDGGKYDERSKKNVFRSDFDTVNKIIPLIWKLRDETTSIFSELELLLEINSEIENKKMTKGLKKIGNDLIEMGNKIIKYTYEENVIIVDEKEK